MNLAYSLRPKSLADFVGQEHLVGWGRIIRKMIEGDNLFSMIFWGPPGSGKTTLAYIISQETGADFHQLSAVESGKEALLKIINLAKLNQQIGKKTILFIDEIHRWNKAQQDVLLPHVESNILILIGATTENPSFEIISPLLSRCRVFVLRGLEKDDLEKIIQRAMTDIKDGLGKYKKKIDKDASELLMRLSGGDARIMLNALEMAVTAYRKRDIDNELVKEVFQTRSAGLYDKKADEHYNIISAFIKSVRGSDPDAALYYLARMLENGEDPKFIARRMIILASEDIGMADRGALIMANAAFDAVTKIGMPEAQLILAHTAIYLSRVPKSRAVPNALSAAKSAVYELPNEPVPLHLRNAPTKLMKQLGYAKDYIWSGGYVGPTEGKYFLPEKLKGRKFYKPSNK
ncbi:replication-associated recombination protein A [Patescibacteria group bacterium]|nr:replication-associated recombination protein A [Patescibacteria group bacterium]MCL5798423.1 replication-associated recombination protein A [Patescibacteria group bacterium]